MKNKLSVSATAASLWLAMTATSANANLLITEYVEGSSNNKAVEVSNVGSEAIDLDAANYVLSLHSNGSATPGNSETLTGVLAPGKSIVYHNGSAADEFKVGTSSTVTYFNGDDAIVLYKDGAVIDRFGQRGVDPGSEWTDANNPDFSTKDKTLRRKESVTVGDINADSPFPGSDNQWEVFAKDTADGLGCPGVSACGEEPGSLIITEYVEGSSNNKAVELSNVGGSALDLDAAVYTISLFSNGSTEGKNTETLSGMLEVGESIVFHNSGATEEFKVGTASTLTYFNGDDALVLFKDGVAIDRFGKVGEDPGSAWTDPNDANFSTANKTLRRKASITTGDSDISAGFPGANNQWLVFDIDTADGLGCAGETACGEEPVDPSPCNNCDVIEPIADPNTFVAADYYSNVLNGEFDSPEALKDAISLAVTAGHVQLSYKHVWTVLTVSDQDPTNSDNIIELYTGNSKSKFGNGGGAEDWNREHVWAKSHGFPSESQLGYTDAHHLRPSYARVNSTKSAYDFDQCSDTGTELTTAPGNYLDTAKRCFEPRDAIKGDVARMMLYMDTRYQGNDVNMPDLVAIDRVTTAEEVSANEPIHGKLCTLYTWHQQDPVDAMDIQRNDAVYAYQGNRNPYIDNPDWVQAVYGDQCGDPLNPVLDVEIVIEAPTQVDEEQAFIIDASGTVATDDATLSFTWEQIAGPTLSFDANAATLNLVATEVSADTQVEFKLVVSDGSLSNETTVAVTIVNTPLVLDVTFTGNDTIYELEQAVITAQVAGDVEGLSYAWEQVSGQTAEFTANGLELSLTAPDVIVDQALVFELTVTKGDEQYRTQVSINVNNTQEEGWVMPESAGNFGLMTLVLLPLLWRRRSI